MQVVVTRGSCDRARIGWVEFRECGQLLNSKRFSLKMKGMVYRICVRLAMLYGRHGGNFEKDRESNVESNVWCKPDGEEEDR